MKANHFDMIVLGVGGMGSAVVHELARRGHRVLGLEQYSLVHDRGSSHGDTRITRKAYYEHPDYVPLLQRAFERWYQLESASGKHLLTNTPCLCIGRDQSKLIRGVMQSAKEHQLDVQYLNCDTLRLQYPQFCLSPEYVATLERDAGFLYVEECVRTHIEQAQQYGAIIHEQEQVVGWESEGEQVRITTIKDTYHAAKLVICGGAWSAKLLQSLNVPLTVMRQILHWIKPQNAQAFTRDHFPVFIIDQPSGNFYGFPVINEASGLKVAQHYGQPEVKHPEEIDWEPNTTDEAAVRAFLSNHMPDVSGVCTRAKVCMYTLTPDRHFIIDIHPQYRNICFAAGFSGHGFKFASVVGEIMADLAERRVTQLPINMLRLNRLT